jgi:alanine racemase
MRPTWCEIDLSAIRDNIASLRERIDGDVCAVVKADAYGHGAVPVAAAAVDAGASQLAVALVEEGIELRHAGLTAPILVLSEPRGSLVDAVRHQLTPTLYTVAGIEEAAEAARDAGVILGVELLVDTGMRRVGAEPGRIGELADLIGRREHLRLDAAWTHCAVADEPENPFTSRQFERFDDVLGELGPIRRHCGNSAVAIAHPAHAHDLVRCGIAIYGIDPSPELAGSIELRPALRLRSEVGFVKRIRAGEGVGYGLRWHAPSDRFIATIPIGYADGVRRDLGLRGGEVLIGGRRRPIVGVVTMDQLMVDLDQDASVATGDAVVLIGRQGDETITAADVAGWLDTIPYEVVCAVSPRVPRRYV